MEKSNPSSEPEIKFAIADKIKKKNAPVEEGEGVSAPIPLTDPVISGQTSTKDYAEANKPIVSELDTDIRVNPKHAIVAKGDKAATDSMLLKVNLSRENKYLLKDAVGKGGMGLVRSVVDTTFNRNLAMKILSPKHLQDESVIKSFIEEAQITAQLEHPNIIPVHDLGVVPQDGNHFYTMKLVKGLSLQEVIQKLKDGDLDFQKEYNLFKMLTIFRKVCDAVAYAHSKKIIHRDIKPGNIMVGEYGEVLLLDWGLAKYAHDIKSREETTAPIDSEVHNSLMTMDGIIKGSLAYLSPEQAHGDIKGIDHQTDIFLLGATLYHMLTLQAPYNSRNMVEIIRMAENGSFTHPNQTEFGKKIPEAVVKIILKSMHNDKSQRYGKVTELIHRIDDYMQGRNVSDLRQYKAGDILIHDQEHDDDTFIIVKGRIEISRNIDGKKTIVDILGPGAVFGELAALTHNLRMATSTALDDTEVMVITKQLMFDEIHKLPPWLEKILFSLASKTSSLNDRIHPFLLSNCSLPVLKQTLYLFSMVNTNPLNTKTVEISYMGLVHEISQNLGLSASRIEEVLNVLEECQLSEKGSNGRFAICNMSDLKSLISYIKREQNITEGMGYDLDNIDIEKIPMLDNIYQRMASLHY